MNQKTPLELIPQKFEFQVFDEMQPWDLSSVEVQILDATYHNWAPFHVLALYDYETKFLATKNASNYEAKGAPFFSQRLKSSNLCSSFSNSRM
ncbi:hypothetical protein TorRG33x02_342020 [Trema orientale]|uniref:Uncharacterized protein n=1 Tax=Trema orientale TaxID=63057 RepID=A0A2P5ASX7_TREOI|nr:hypothetical protein TorRG33x02_342020 [Trema orientale]